MMSGQGAYYGQSAVWLAAHKTALLSAIDAVTLGKSVTIAGRTVSRLDLKELREDLAAVQEEIDRQAATTNTGRTIYANFSSTGSDY